MSENKFIERIARIFQHTKKYLDNVGDQSIQRKDIIEAVAKSLNEDATKISNYIVDCAREFGHFSQGKNGGWRRGPKKIKIIKNGTNKLSSKITESTEDSQDDLE